MIDRTQLTEALAVSPYTPPVILEAARLLLDFPTDEQVEAADKAFVEWPGGSEWDYDTRRKEAIRAALEAVRRVMFGEESG